MTRFAPAFEPVEDRLAPAFPDPLAGVPQGVVLIPAPGGAGLFRLINPQTGDEAGTIRPFPDGFVGEVRAATGDLAASPPDNNPLSPGDGSWDLVVGAGPGGGPRVRALNGRTGEVAHDFFAFEPEFRGGVYVAAADVNRDAVADIVVGAGEGGGARVRVFDGRTGAVLADFLAFEESFRGGVRVAAGDVDNDRAAEVVAAPGPGREPRVVVFDVSPAVAVVDTYLAYEPDFRGGVHVTATRDGPLYGGGAYTGWAAAAVVTAPGAGGGPVVRVAIDGAAVTRVVGDPAGRAGVQVFGNSAGFVAVSATPAGPVLRSYPFHGHGGVNWVLEPAAG